MPGLEQRSPSPHPILPVELSTMVLPSLARLAPRALRSSLASAPLAPKAKLASPASVGAFAQASKRWASATSAGHEVRLPQFDGLKQEWAGRTPESIATDVRRSPATPPPLVGRLRVVPGPCRCPRAIAPSSKSTPGPRRKTRPFLPPIFANILHLSEPSPTAMTACSGDLR